MFGGGGFFAGAAQGLTQAQHDAEVERLKQAKEEKEAKVKYLNDLLQDPSLDPNSKPLIFQKIGAVLSHPLGKKYSKDLSDYVDENGVHHTLGMPIYSQEAWAKHQADMQRIRESRVNPTLPAPPEHGFIQNSLPPNMAGEGFAERVGQMPAAQPASAPFSLPMPPTAEGGISPQANSGEVAPSVRGVGGMTPGALPAPPLYGDTAQPVPQLFGPSPGMQEELGEQPNPQYGLPMPPEEPSLRFRSKTDMMKEQSDAVLAASGISPEDAEHLSPQERIALVTGRSLPKDNSVAELAMLRKQGLWRNPMTNAIEPIPPEQMTPFERAHLEAEHAKATAVAARQEYMKALIAMQNDPASMKNRLAVAHLENQRKLMELTERFAASREKTADTAAAAMEYNLYGTVNGQVVNGTPLDEDNNPIGKWAFSETGPTAQNKARSAVAVTVQKRIRELRSLAARIEDRFGPVQGTFDSWVNKKGLTEDPDVSRFRMEQTSLAQFMPAVHNFRNYRMAEHMEKAIGDLGQPYQNFIAGLDALDAVVGNVAEESSRPSVPRAKVGNKIQKPKQDRLGLF